jgi:hypothetical protein
MAGGGGYVLNSVHNIQGDVSPENIIALFDEGYAFGTYPLPDGRMYDESHAEGSGPRSDPPPRD